MQPSSSPPSSGAEPKFSRYRSQRRNANNSQNTAESSPPADKTTNTVERTRSRYHRQQRPEQPTSPPIFAAAHDNLEQSNKPDDNQSPASAERNLSPRAEALRKKRLEDNSVNRRVTAKSGARDTSGHHSRERLKDNEAHDRNDSPLSPDRKDRLSTPPITQAPREIRAHRVDEVEDEDREPGCFAFLKKKKVEDTSIRTEKNPTPKRSSEPAFIKQGGGGIVPGIDAPKSAVNAGDRRVLVDCNTSSMYFPIDAATTAAELLNSAANCFSEPIDTKTYVLLESFGKVRVQRPLRKYERVRDVINSWDDDLQNSLIVVPASAPGSDATLLHASSVPHVKPEETSFLLHYSQKVGKWDKRQITIRTDGQVVARKSPSDKDGTNVCHLSDFDIYTPNPRQMSKKIKPPKKNCFAVKSQQKTSMFETTSNFVHFFCVNDRNTAWKFYTAVQGWRSWYLVNMMGEGQKKQSRPVDPLTTISPQRHASVRNTANHTHHESTNSMDSHYHLGSFKPLVDVDQFDERPVTLTGVSATQAPARKPSTRERAHPPLSLPKHLHAADNANTTVRQSLDGGERNSDTFASSGLLGRSYSQRQREQVAREAQAAKPFIEGASLLNGDLRPPTSDGPKRSSSTRHASNPRSGQTNTGTDIRRQLSTRDGGQGSGDLARSNSRREPPKPLIDLTPTYREPPQFQRKGKGYKPEQIGPGGLVDAATSPEEAIQVPAATDWRGRHATRDLHSSHAGGGGIGASTGSAQQRPTSRNRSSSRSRQPAVARFQNTDAYAALTGGKAPVQDERALRRQFSGERESDAAFVNGGLLEQAGGGWGGQNTGRGVGQGSNAKGPLVDMSEGSRYAPGSLLARQERNDGVRAPVIDRER